MRRWAGEVQLQLQSKCRYAKQNVLEHQKLSSANLLSSHPSVMAATSLVKRRSAGRWVGNHKGMKVGLRGVSVRKQKTAREVMGLGLYQEAKSQGDRGVFGGGAEASRGLSDHFILNYKVVKIMNRI